MAVRLQRVPVLKVCEYRGHERLQQLGLLQLAEIAQRRASHILVGMDQIVTKGVAVIVTWLIAKRCTNAIRVNHPSDGGAGRCCVA